MSLTAHDPLRMRARDIDGQGQVEPPADEDTIVVTCAACGGRQAASGRAAGYRCERCGTDWRVLRCRGCRQASIVLEGVSDCPRCGHEHRATARLSPALPSWLMDPAPLSIWLGGAKYLGGHAEREQPVAAAGLLLDRRGFHVRAFAELFTIPWSTVRSMKIEGPADISERITMSRLVALGASTWVTSVSYLTVHTARGDAIFEIDGLGPPELRARLSRVLQALEPSAPAAEPITLEPVADPLPAPAPRSAPDASPKPAAVEPVEPTALAIDPSTTEAPLAVLVVDALWKLAQLRESGLLHPDEVAVLRAQLLARISGDALGSGPDGLAGGGPLLRV